MLATLEFEPGATEKQVEICIVDDKFIEVDETFVLYLSSGTGVFLSPFAQTEVTIINNDGMYIYSSRIIVLCMAAIADTQGCNNMQK